jgi:membrane-bound serine protease (ClpP class)
LSLDHEEATEVINGKPVLAKGIAEDIEDLVEQEGLTGEVVIAKPLGFENLAMWVTRLAPILLIVAIAGAYMEYNAPGFGLPGIVSVLAFSIFFFGHYLAGKLAGFEIVAIFVLGIVLIAVEIFLFPGVIVIGLAGVLMVFGALLYTLAGIQPGGSALSVNMGGLKGAVRDLGISLLGATALILILMRYMKHVPGFNRLVLSEAIAEGPALGEGELVPGGGEAPNRVGQSGVTMTDLRPAGKGRFGDDILDVVSDGDFIGKNMPIRIAAQEGARIVVVEIPG